MLAKPLLLILIAACAAPSGAAANSNSNQPDPDEPIEVKPPPLEEGQHFCCQSLGTGTGNDCIFIGDKQAPQCDKLLYCAGSYMKDGNTVTCL
jgi:hypothetical protein